MSHLRQQKKPRKRQQGHFKTLAAASVIMLIEKERYKDLITDQKKHFKSVKFVHEAGNFIKV